MCANLVKCEMMWPEVDTQKESEKQIEGIYFDPSHARVMKQSESHLTSGVAAGVRFKDNKVILELFRETAGDRSLTLV